MTNQPNTTTEKRHHCGRILDESGSCWHCDGGLGTGICGSCGKKTCECVGKNSMTTEKGSMKKSKSKKIYTKLGALLEIKRMLDRFTHKEPYISNTLQRVKIILEVVDED